MDTITKSVVLERSKRSLGIRELEEETNKLTDLIDTQLKTGKRPWKSYAKLVKNTVSLRRLYKKLPSELKRMGYDPDEILP